MGQEGEQSKKIIGSDYQYFFSKVGVGKVLTFYLGPFFSPQQIMVGSAIPIIEIEKQRPGVVEWMAIEIYLLGRMGLMYDFLLPSSIRGTER